MVFNLKLSGGGLPRWHPFEGDFRSVVVCARLTRLPRRRPRFPIARDRPRSNGQRVGGQENVFAEVDIAMILRPIEPSATAFG